MGKKPRDEESDRLLSTPELAHYLHLSEKTVHKLAQEGKVPALLVDKQWRFKRNAIDKWLEQTLVGDQPGVGDIPNGVQVPLDDLIPDAAIITDLVSTDPLPVIEELAARAYTNKWLNDKPWFVGAVVERESLASTAMEGGVAFLHTRQRDMGKIGRPFIIVGRSWKGIAFNAPDGKPTYLFFLLGLKYDKLHLPILGRLARALRNPATIGRLRAMSSSQQIRALLLKEDSIVMGGPASPPRYEPAKPKLDKMMRLRTIRRLGAERTKATREEEDRVTEAGKAAEVAEAKKESARVKSAAKSAAKAKAKEPAKEAAPAAPAPAAKAKAPPPAAAAKETKVTKKPAPPPPPVAKAKATGKAKAKPKAKAR
jgi:excisionase family DNA binding protein